MKHQNKKESVRNHSGQDQTLAIRTHYYMEHTVCFGKHPTVPEYRHIWNYRKRDWRGKGQHKLLNPAVKANASFQSPQYFQ